MARISEGSLPQLKPTIETFPFDTIEEGEFLMLRNPENARYLKLKKKATIIIENMDGKTSVAQLQKMYKDIDVFHLIEILAKAGFLIDIEAEKYTGPLYTVKIPFFDTNKDWMKKMYHFFRFTGSKSFLIVYSLFVLSGFILLLKNFGIIVGYAYMNFHLGIPLKYFFAFFALSYIVELAHEFAHTGASYNCGAEPGKLGLVFHFLVAFFYVDTPNTRILDRKGNIKTFISGPLLSLLAATLCIYMFLFTDWMPVVWASSAFFWYISTAITLSPFMQTDGYYIVQCLAKFPNLLENSLIYWKTQLKRIFRLMSKEEYAKIMSKWNNKQKKFLRIYMIWWPVQTLILMYFFFFSVNKANVINVLKVFPEIISPASPYGSKGYFLAVLYTWGIIAGVLPIVLTIRKYIKKRGDDYSIQPR